MSQMLAGAFRAVSLLSGSGEGFMSIGMRFLEAARMRRLELNRTPLSKQSEGLLLKFFEAANGYVADFRRIRRSTLSDLEERGLIAPTFRKRQHRQRLLPSEAFAITEAGYELSTLIGAELPSRRIKAECRNETAQFAPGP